MNQAFQLIKQRLAKLPEVTSRVAQKGADAFTARAREAFDSGKGVYGNSFEGLDGNPLTLKESGKLREKALKYDAHGSRIRVSVGALAYAKYCLKFGILPRPGQLPPTWVEDLNEIIDDELSTAAKAAGGS